MRKRSIPHRDRAGVRRGPGVVVKLGGGGSKGLPSMADFAADRVRDEDSRGVDAFTQLALRGACEVVGIPYPARTRAEAVEAAVRVREEFGMSPYRPEDVARMGALEDHAQWTGLDPSTRYLLDAVECRTLSGIRSTAEFLWHRVTLEKVLEPDGSRSMVERMVTPRREDVARLALVMASGAAPTSVDGGNRGALAIARLVSDERRARVKPLPEEVSPLDVHAESYNRAMFHAIGRPYPPGTRSDTLFAIQAMRVGFQGLPPMPPDVVAVLSDNPDVGVVAPRLSAFDGGELLALLMRDEPTGEQR